MTKDLKMVYTACQGYGCHEHCTISTFVDENGVIDHCERMVLPKEIQDNEDPYYLGARSYICHKGVISGKIPYMKERLRYPMKRVGERGVGPEAFERINWDEALDEIAAKLMELKETYGPASVMINDFPCGYAGMPFPLAYTLEQRFKFANGFSSLEWEGIDISVIKGPAMFFGDDTKSVFTDTMNVNYADYVIIWGGNSIGYTRGAHTTHSLIKLQSEGIKLVDIGILFDATAAKCNETLLVKPASDTALALAMANHIIQSGRADEDFLTRKTVAPFLVRNDDGKFLRESDVVDGGDPGNYVYWNAEASEPGFIARGVHDMGGAQVDLDASVTVAGIECKTAYLLLKEQLAEYTFERQEGITGVPAAQAQRIIEEYADHENATIWVGAGLRYKNSTAAVRAISLLAMLTGHYENKACGMLIEGTQDSFPVQTNDMPIIFGLGENMKFCKLALMKDVIDSFENPQPGQQEYKALINLYSNPVHNWPPRELWEKRFFPNMELVVVSEIRWTETCDFADYVLPDLTTFERECFFVQGGYLIQGDPAIEPVGEARDLAEVLSDLARRMGLGELFQLSAEEWQRMRLESPDPAIATVEPKITLDRLREEKLIKLNDAGRCYHLFNDAPINLPSGRLEFYSETVAGLPGGALAEPVPALIDDEERREKYPLHLFIGRSRFFMQGQFREIPELRKLSGDGPRIGMRKEDAIARGINEGDLVEIFNERGVVKVPCHFSNFIQPGMAHLWYAYGVQDYDLSGPATILGANQNIDEAIDPVAATWGPFWRGLKNASGMPEALGMSSGEIANETIWDVLCDIRRAE